MTKKQKIKILHQAAEMIESGDQDYSCLAVEQALGRPADLYRGYHKFTESYAAFYGQTPKGWATYVDEKPHRIILLLNFAEAVRRGIA